MTTRKAYFAWNYFPSYCSWIEKSVVTHKTNKWNLGLCLRKSLFCKTSKIWYSRKSIFWLSTSKFGNFWHRTQRLANNCLIGLISRILNSWKRSYNWIRNSLKTFTISQLLVRGGWTVLQKLWTSKLLINDIKWTYPCTFDLKTRKFKKIIVTQRRSWVSHHLRSKTRKPLS